MALIETFGGRMHPISLQKSLFLFTREQEPEERVYSFVPYKYGCFSFNVNHDISVLEKTGYLRREDKEIVIATPGHYAAQLDLFDSGRLHHIYDLYKDFTVDDFIDYTYKTIRITPSIVRLHIST